MSDRERNWKKVAEGRRVTLKQTRNLLLDCKQLKLELEQDLRKLRSSSMDAVGTLTGRLSYLQVTLNRLTRPGRADELPPPIETKVLGWTPELGYYVTWQTPWGCWNMEGSINIGPPEYYVLLPKPPDGETY